MTQGQRAKGTGQRGDAPDAAIEIAAHRVTVVGLSRGAATVQGWASEPLPAGAVVPSLTALNIVDTGAVTAAVRQALAHAGVKARRAGLVIPDLAAKVSLVPFEKIPERRQDLAGLITWQVRKSAPFRIDDAQLAFVEGARYGDAGRTFVVTLARKDIVRQYEDVCAAAGVHTGIVDLASFNVINAALAQQDAALSGSQADWLLVNSTAESQTLAIMRGDTLMFFRSKPIDADESLADLVHQTAMYYEDRLQGAGFAQVVLAGTAAESGEAVRRGLAERLHAPVVALEPGQVTRFAARDPHGLPPAAAGALLAPLGLLMRERAA
jgi:type IV pilus assembly protein PilM